MFRAMKGGEMPNRAKSHQIWDEWSRAKVKRCPIEFIEGVAVMWSVVE